MADNEPKKSWWQRLSSGLQRSSSALGTAITDLVAKRKLDAAAIDAVEAAVRAVPTEASAMAVRCARGETGVATIRNGRRTVQLTPLGGMAGGLLLHFISSASI